MIPSVSTLASGAGVRAPATAEEMAAALAEAASQGAVRIGGHFTKDRLGGPLAEAASILSTRELRRVLMFEPKDLTISVEAGLRWAELTRILDAENIMIPLDPPFAEEATVGGVVASNLGGPRRRLYGTARDNVIGMKFAAADGRIIQSGGMVVKNVAGLDMGKLHIGAWGTLGVMLSINFKLTPKPPGERTFLLRGPLGECIAARDAILRGVLQPSAVDLVNPQAAQSLALGLGPDAWCLLVRAGGNDAVLDRYARELPGFTAVDTAIWRQIEEFPRDHLAGNADGWMRSESGTLTELAALAAAIPDAVIARAANGVVYRFGTGPAPDPWPRPGSGFAVMRRVKDLLDPEYRLNPGRLHGRI
jgi:glycolate oxidase FAD binding subunit